MSWQWRIKYLMLICDGDLKTNYDILTVDLEMRSVNFMLLLFCITLLDGKKKKSEYTQKGKPVMYLILEFYNMVQSYHDKAAK